eukprot:TRINITY_DN27446_c0_g1_i1.p1 TRINITY_DN27446_c0_g1~~TRINITY_DN27446_c0_g1_i1.p1  ORF type:complete len:1300 (+),score=335.55 TRINITY_DN27446_c0_g1_i1:105-4004(+)
MSPPPLWEDTGEEDEYYGEDDYPLEDDEDCWDTESDYCHSEAESDRLPIRCWPDVFDEGTEASSTGARSTPRDSLVAGRSGASTPRGASKRRPSYPPLAVRPLLGEAPSSSSSASPSGDAAAPPSAASARGAAASSASASSSSSHWPGAAAGDAVKSPGMSAAQLETEWPEGDDEVAGGLMALGGMVVCLSMPPSSPTGVVPKARWHGEEEQPPPWTESASLPSSSPALFSAEEAIGGEDREVVATPVLAVGSKAFLLPQSLGSSASSTAWRMGTGEGDVHGDFRACPLSYWQHFHAKAGWPAAASGAQRAAVQTEAALAPDAAMDAAPSFAAEVSKEEQHMSERLVLDDWRQTLEQDEGADGSSDSEEEDDDELVDGFFVSAGGALSTVLEEESADLSSPSWENRPSGALLAYVAAAGAIVVSQDNTCKQARGRSSDLLEEAAEEEEREQEDDAPSSDADAEASEEQVEADAMLAALRLQSAERGRQARLRVRQLRSLRVAESCVAEPLVMEKEQELSTVASQAAEIDEASALGIQIMLKAKELVAAAVLKAVFVVQAGGHGADDVKPAQEEPAADSPALANNLEGDAVSSSPFVAELRHLEGQASPKAAKTVSASTSAGSLLLHMEESLPATPSEAASKADVSQQPEPHQAEVAAEKTDTPTALMAMAEGAEEATPSKASATPSAAPSAASSACQTPTSAPGRRLVCAKRRGNSAAGSHAATRPRQPLPRGDKRPPVPRAGVPPRPGHSERLGSHEKPGSRERGSSAGSTSRCGSAGAASSLPASCAASPRPSSGASQGKAGAKSDGGDISRPGSVPARSTSEGGDSCYEVSEQAFEELLEGGLLLPDGAASTEQYYEISEEEFERLMQAGQLFSSAEVPGEEAADRAATSSSPSPAVEPYEISDSQFEELLQAGVLRPNGPDRCDGAPLPRPASKEEQQQQRQMQVAGYKRAHDWLVGQPQQPAGVSPRKADIVEGPKARTAGGSAEAGAASGRAAHRQPLVPKPPADKPPPRKERRRPSAGSVGSVGEGSSKSRSGSKSSGASAGAAAGGGLFFLPTDGVPKRNGQERSYSSSPQHADFEGPDIYMEQQRFEGRVAAGSPLHSARWLRELRTPHAHGGGVAAPPSLYGTPPPAAIGCYNMDSYPDVSPMVSRAMSVPPGCYSSGGSQETSPVPPQDLSTLGSLSRRKPLHMPRTPVGKLPRLATAGGIIAGAASASSVAGALAPPSFPSGHHGQAVASFAAAAGFAAGGAGTRLGAGAGGVSGLPVQHRTPSPEALDWDESLVGGAARRPSAVRL